MRSKLLIAAAFAFCLTAVGMAIVRIWPLLKIMAQIIISTPEFGMLTVGLAVTAIGLGFEWNAAYNHIRCQTLSLAVIERAHPRLPRQIEIYATALLTLTLCVLFTQFVATVYAAAFSLYASSAETKVTRHVEVFDINGDGHLDYVAGNFDLGGAYLLDQYINDGSGNFTHSGTFDTSSNFTEFAAGDVDGDGDMDLVSGFETGADSLHVVKNQGGTLINGLTIIQYSASLPVSAVRLADMDSDGDLDIVYVSESGNPTDAVWKNNGHGVFSTFATGMIDQANDLAVADVTSDGYIDIIIAAGGYMEIYKNNGNATFTQIESFNDVSDFTWITTGDYDGDGDIDVLASFDDNSKAVTFCPNSGNGTFGGSCDPAAFNTGNQILTARTADLNNDGHLDVIVGEKGNNEIALGDGTGDFALNGLPASELNYSNAVAIGDIDTDGDADYIAGTQTPGAGGAANYVYKNDHSVTLANTAPSAPSTGFSATLTSYNTLSYADSLDDAGIGISLDIGADGLPIMSYHENGFDDLKVAKCANPACTSGTTVSAVDATGNVGNQSAIAVDSNNLATIAYHDTTNSDLKVARCSNTACSSSTLASVDITGVTGDFPAIALDASGIPVIAYEDSATVDLKIVKCGNATCTSGNTYNTVDSAGDVGTHNSIAIPADGLPVVSYADGNPNFDLKVLKCGNAACSAGNTVTTVDSAGSVGAYSSIAISLDGFPVISYQDSTNADLKVMKCGNATCTSGNTITTVDSVGSVGQYTSIAVPADGRPYISYYDTTNTNLKVLRCGNAACSSGNVATTVDSLGDMGLYSSIALNTSDSPVVAYYDNSNGNAKVAACGGDCSAGGEFGGMDFRLRWGSGSDDITPLRRLQYQVRVGTGAAAGNINPAKAASPNHTMRQMPNGQSKTLYLKNQTCGLTYYWAVRTVDNAMRVSAESSEQSFTVNSVCSLGSPAVPPPPPPPPSGGGTLWRMAERNNTEKPAASIGLSGRLFLDIDGDGIRSENERWLGLADVSITAGGLTAKTDANGLYTIPVPEGSYTVTVDKATITGYEVTDMAALQSVVVSDAPATADIPLRWSAFIGHAPCLRIASDADNGTVPEEQRLLTSLRDAFGKPAIVFPADTSGLIKRDEFFSLLAATQCVDSPVSADDTLERLKNGKRRPFVDLLPKDNAKTLRIYGLALADVSVARGYTIDAEAFVTRGEALHTVFQATGAAEWAATHDAVVKKVTAPADAGNLERTVQTLSALDMLPSSMTESVSRDRGMVWAEAIDLLSRAAFSSGRISLVHEDGASEADRLGEPFDLLLPCWHIDQHRSMDLFINDAAPGTSVAADIVLLTMLGAKRGTEILWVIPGDAWLTDLGVTRGHLTLRPADPVTIADALRTLLVFSCLPQRSRAQALQEMTMGRTVTTGSPESLLGQDRIAGVRESPGILSRVILDAQRPGRFANLSPVFSFTDALMDEENRNPRGSLSIDEGSELIASTLLQMLVRQEFLTRIEAENAMQQAVYDVRDFILDGRTLDSRTAPLTRGDLIHALAGAARNAIGLQTGMPSAGELWWQRIRNWH